MNNTFNPREMATMIMALRTKLRDYERAEHDNHPVLKYDYADMLALHDKLSDQSWAQYNRGESGKSC